MLSRTRSISDQLETKAPEAPGCTNGVTSVTIKSIYFNSSALAVLDVKHIKPTFRIPTVSDSSALDVELTKATDTY